MASYTLLSSYSTVQVLSSTLVNDVVYCTIQTSPSNVVASLPVQADVFTAGGAGPELTNFAEAIEEAMSHIYVIAGVGRQTIDASGLLADTVVFTVQYPNTATAPTGVTAEAVVPVGLLNYSDAEIGRVLEQQVHDIINAAYASLANAAGG